MNGSTRDLGFSGPGKGDHDRTTDVESFEKNLDAIERHPEDKTGFEKVGEKRWRKTYGKPAETHSTPENLHDAHRSACSYLRGTGSCSSDH